MSSASSSPVFQFDAQEQLAVVTFFPALVEASWAEISTAGDEIIGQLGERKLPRCLIDLSQLTYMGSSTVALIVRLWKSLQTSGGQSAVVSVHPVVTQVMKLAGLDKVWTIVGSRDEGKAALGMGTVVETRLASSGALLTLAVFGTVIAVAGVALREIGGRFLAIPVAVPLIGAAIGFVLGICSVFRDRSLRRYFGLACVLCAVAAALCGVWRLSQQSPESVDPPVSTNNTLPTEPTKNSLPPVPTNNTLSPEPTNNTLPIVPSTNNGLDPPPNETSTPAEVP